MTSGPAAAISSGKDVMLYGEKTKGDQKVQFDVSALQESYHALRAAKVKKPPRWPVALASRPIWNRDGEHYCSGLGTRDHQPKDTASVCENPARIARVTKSDRKAQSIVVAPMLAYGRQVSASQEASAVLAPDHYPCIVT